tara:strand:- start:928 stop:1131 length:204 start_codon:yes stop_codon:yes gene_type:complete
MDDLVTIMNRTLHMETWERKALIDGTFASDPYEAEDRLYRESAHRADILETERAELDETPDYEPFSV